MYLANPQIRSLHIHDIVVFENEVSRFGLFVLIFNMQDRSMAFASRALKNVNSGAGGDNIGVCRPRSGFVGGDA